MATIRFQDVTRHFSGAAEPAVAGANLHVADGEAVAFLGPPGAGKTTLLRLAGGLEIPDGGRVVLGDPEGVDDEIEVVLLFQNYAIYPHLSVRDNIATPLRLRQTPQEVEANLDEVVDLLGLGELTNRPASSLSTSERMRVAMARALARRPGVLLLDEPLANLEPGIRRDLRDRLVAAQHAFSVTTLYATEDPEEASAVAVRVVRVQDGRLRET
jgi:multiple sugar transport system ATP-binding protein